MKTHTGGCQCGRVRYSVKTDLEKVIECNCSICSKHGLLLTFVPKEQFELIQGEPDLTEYRFNTMKIQHLFCKVCGVESFGRGKDKEGNETVALNIRTIDDIDLGAIARTFVDGKSW